MGIIAKTQIKSHELAKQHKDLLEIKMQAKDETMFPENKLIGLTIEGVSYMTEEEAEGIGWSCRPIVLHLTGGLWLLPLSDDEGNNGGTPVSYTHLTLPTKA